MDKIKNHSWSPDACVGESIANGRFKRSLTVCTKTLYNHIDLGLLDVKNTDLTMKLRSLFGKQFSQVFKTIAGDNGSEFANLSTLEIETDTNVYFTHPYSSFEKGTNERHNSLIRRFIPKGKRISDYTSDDIAFIEEWINTIPRRILNYKTPEELFEAHLDKIYAV